MRSKPKHRTFDGKTRAEGQQDTVLTPPRLVHPQNVFQHEQYRCRSPVSGISQDVPARTQLLRLQLELLAQLANDLGSTRVDGPVRDICLGKAQRRNQFVEKGVD